MGVGIGAQDVRQDHGVGVVGLLAGDSVSFPVAGDGHRVDRIDRPSGLPKRGNEQSARGFDRHWDRVIVVVAGISQHGHQLGEAVSGLGDAALGHQLAVGVDQGDVVIPVGPVDAAEHLHSELLLDLDVVAGQRPWRERAAT